MATAQSYQAELPSVSVPQAQDDFSFEDGPTTGKSLGARITRFFGGKDQEQAYQNLLTENNRQYEQALLKEQRNYEEYVRNREYEREDTKMQRLMKDYKAAGLNPWLALQGGISGSSAQSQPAGNGNFSGGSSAKSKDEKSTGAISGIIAGVAKILAALIAA